MTSQKKQGQALKAGRVSELHAYKRQMLLTASSPDWRRRSASAKKPQRFCCLQLESGQHIPTIRLAHPKSYRQPVMRKILRRKVMHDRCSQLSLPLVLLVLLILALFLI